MSKPTCYELLAVADRDSLADTGRNVMCAMSRGMRYLLHNLVILPIAGCLSMIWLHDPVNTPHPQGRSRILLAAKGDPVAHKLLVQTINCLGYRFNKSEIPGNFPFDDLKHNCDITRSHIIITPSVSKEFNPDVLPGYFMAPPFEADSGNDFSALDNFFNSIVEPVAWCLSMERCNTSAVSRVLARYCEYLSAVNSGRLDQSSFITGRNCYRFDKQKDPLADETRRNIAKLLSGLGATALSFSIRSLALSKGRAQLSAALLAGSCFCDGYDLHPDSVSQKQALKALRTCSLLLPDISFKTGYSESADIYVDLKPMINLASPPELSGIFRLPVASESYRPQCLACDTDPPVWPRDEMLLLGQEVRAYA
ncbi:MAG: hypothetical protein GY869_00795 [Planctomycetes bacterium]|nr:hypothetical protein [Planctomycetota bacterium]